MVLNNIVFHAQCGHFLYYIGQFKASPLSIYDHRNRSTYAHTKKITQKQKALSELNQIGLSDYSIARYYLNGIYCTNASIAS